MYFCLMTRNCSSSKQSCIAGVLNSGPGTTSGPRTLLIGPWIIMTFFDVFFNFCFHSLSYLVDHWRMSGKKYLYSQFNCSIMLYLCWTKTFTFLYGFVTVSLSFFLGPICWNTWTVDAGRRPRSRWGKITTTNTGRDERHLWNTKLLYLFICLFVYLSRAKVKVEKCQLPSSDCSESWGWSNCSVKERASERSSGLLSSPCRWEKKVS